MISREGAWRREGLAMAKGETYTIHPWAMFRDHARTPYAIVYALMVQVRVNSLSKGLM